LRSVHTVPCAKEEDATNTMAHNGKRERDSSDDEEEEEAEKGNAEEEEEEKGNAEEEKAEEEETPLNTDDDCDDADPLPVPGERLIWPQHLAPARPDPPKKKKKPKKDLLAVFGSHEMVLTHHMHLPAGFTMETDEEHKLQIITPKRTKSNEIKSFRARLGKHLRAIGFVCLENDDDKPEDEAQFAHLDLCEKYMDSWVRPTVDTDGANVALDKHTLKPPADPAVREQLQLVDPFDLV